MVWCGQHSHHGSVFSTRAAGAFSATVDWHGNHCWAGQAQPLHSCEVGVLLNPTAIKITGLLEQAQEENIQEKE
jgi:hypothetical protein